MPKIIGFTQLRNELEKENLDNFFLSMEEVCDEVYVYDQGSSDANLDAYKRFGWKYIRSEENNFINELFCKQELLNKLLEEQHDCDWIFWMDGDTILDGRLGRSEMDRLCAKDGVGAYTFGHYNLWRSDCWYRTDNAFHGLHGGVCALWKNIPGLSIIPKKGMHGSQVPAQLGNRERCEYNLIHRGFATDLQILNRYFERYAIYRSNNQPGTILNRLFDESTLSCEPLPEGVLPSWFDIQQPEDPANIPRMIELYRDKLEAHIGDTWETFKAKHGHQWRLG